MIEQLSKAQEEFSADDLRKVMRPAPNRYWTGLAFTHVQNAGLIEWVRYQKSTTKSRKKSPVSIWRRTQEGVTK